MTELVTNALLHGDGPISVQFQHETGRGVLRVVVADATDSATVRGPVRGTTVNERRAPHLEESGRGLAIVAAVASRWGASVEQDATRVWFELGARHPSG